MTDGLLISTDYFTKVLEDNLKAVVKPQYVDQIPKAVKGSVRKVSELVKARSQMDNMDHILNVLGRLSSIHRRFTVANRLHRAQAGR